MLSTQQILQSLSDMQANAQQALPVIPNNGNPAGASNMPHRRMLPPQQQQPTGGYDSSGIIPQNQQPRPGSGRLNSPMAERYPWLRSSGSMDNIRNYLSGRRNLFPQNQPPATAPQPQPPVVPVLGQQPTRMTFAGGLGKAPLVDDPVSYPVMPLPAPVM